LKAALKRAKRKKAAFGLRRVREMMLARSVRIGAQGATKLPRPARAMVCAELNPALLSATTSSMRGVTRASRW